ncbi:tRNA uracil 4-sulfurtransferase ThiI [Mycoplasma sp. P36-A1]|uniref:tRNA uracil 4-sulfurtransferase ThiI n=1 Tax=Mycoplasma sp. P36-A1 TaxID=3252900 RepID=UPI003C2FED27
MQDVILIRYGELNTKGKNRRFFINKLENNIKKRLKQYPEIKIDSRRDRMYITFDQYDVNQIMKNLKNVFGIANFSLAKKVKPNYEIIEKTVMEIIDFNKYKTFKVITKRGNKQFPMISDEINRSIATKVLQETDLKVDVRNYDLGINIDIRYDYAYIFFEKIPGAKGYPVGVSGNGLLMLSGGIDSPVAGYMVMKRGVSLHAIHFASPPYTSQKALSKVIKLSAKYLDYTEEVILHNVPFTNMQLELNKHVDINYSMTIMRRMMYRISEEIARRNNCKILINGESIAQVASQTLQSMFVINNVTSMPIIRPLAAFDKEDIIDIAKRIDTYETSILPYEDCCTIFLPANPVIEPSLEVTLKNEERFDFEPLLKETIENTERIIINQETIATLLNVDEDLF